MPALAQGATRALLQGFNPTEECYEATLDDGTQVVLPLGCVVLPKGCYRLSRPLVLRRRGGALVGVGRTISLLVPASSAGLGEVALVRVQAEGVTVGMISIVVWDHMPGTYAVEWAGGGGVWRQAWFNRMTEASFPPFSAAAARRVEAAPRAPTRIDRPMFVLSGGGAFYDFNLDLRVVTRCGKLARGS